MNGIPEFGESQNIVAPCVDLALKVEVGWRRLPILGVASGSKLRLPYSGPAANETQTPFLRNFGPRRRQWHRFARNMHLSPQAAVAAFGMMFFNNSHGFHIVHRGG